MAWKKIAAIIVTALLTFISACSLPFPVVISGENPYPSTATVDIQMQVAGTVAVSTMAVTPTLTFTITPTSPMVSVSVQTNCRSGPGTAYDVLGIFNVGETAEVVGRSASSDNWIIKLPSNPAVTCWLWGQYATVAGNTAGLTVYAPPPPPAASFAVSYHATTTCERVPGYGYRFLFKITNNGSVTWESGRLTATDPMAGITATINRNDFYYYDGCGEPSVYQNIDPGEVIIASTGSFSENPAGHSITATIRVCSQDGPAGLCLEKTITFTP